MLCNLHRFPDSFVRDRAFVTKRCSIKLQDEEVEIEMTGSRENEEALGTNNFNMAEIEADDYFV